MPRSLLTNRRASESRRVIEIGWIVILIGARDMMYGG